ncbi:MAG: pentapeptide repeat-containing protein [Colwellia sp.]|nr:pentapeptide repeat-containing protein [Colwellia sp.]
MKRGLSLYYQAIQHGIDGQFAHTIWRRPYFWYIYEHRYEYRYESIDLKLESVKQVMRKNYGKSILAISILLLVVLLIVEIIPSSNKGTRWIRVDLKHQNLISTPIENDDYDGIPWVDLAKAHLEGAKLHYSVLKRANLKKAKLQNATLNAINLEGAILSEANLQNANLYNANLKRANLKNAELQNARLDDANLQGAYLKGVDFEGTNLQGAYFSAYFNEVMHGELVVTDFSGAKNLTIDQLSKTKTLYNAKLDSVLMEQVKEKCPHLLEKPKKEEVPKQDE